MTKIGWLIYNREDAKKNKAYIDWMLEEAKELGMELQFHYREDLQIGHRNHQLFINIQQLLLSRPLMPSSEQLIHF